MQTIYLSDHGITPGSDVTLALKVLFERYPADTVFVFEKGDYSFSPYEEMQADYRISNSDVKPYRVLGLWMKNMDHCIFRGNGARLLFAGHMQPVTMDHCSHLKMENFIIDWEKPLVAEGIIVAVHENCVDMHINSELYPHKYENNWICFDTGADEWYPLNKCSLIQFDQNNRCVHRDSGDKFIPGKIEALGNDIYRITPQKMVEVSVGNIFVLRHNARMHAGIFTEKCTDITFEDITVHSCGGLGCLAQFCHDLTYRRVHFIPNTAVGRLSVSGRDDGMHLTCNSGHITVTECTFLGLMDDPINVHSCCVTSDEVVDNKTLRCRYRHEQAQGFLYWAEPGEEITFIERKHMSAIGVAKVSSYELETMDTFLLRFEQPLDEEILAAAATGDMLALDNADHTAAFTCTNNRFGSCRARGILISTPKPVVISRNLFASSGSAILVAGDSNYWFESGECHDVEISDNVFTDTCLSSMYQFCDGIISICPVIPEADTAKPFHKNIRITDNVFDTADTPVLYAYSCAGLTFSRNRIFKSPAAAKWHPGNWLINLSACREVTLTHNDWIGDFGLDKYHLENCENVVTGATVCTIY